MYNESMNSQELKLADDYLGLLEFLPPVVRGQVFEKYFLQHKEELEDSIFYLQCKEARNSESVSEKELWDELKRRG